MHSRLAFATAATALVLGLAGCLSPSYSLDEVLGEGGDGQASGQRGAGGLPNVAGAASGVKDAPSQGVPTLTAGPDPPKDGAGDRDEPPADPDAENGTGDEAAGNGSQDAPDGQADGNSSDPADGNASDQTDGEDDGSNGSDADNGADDGTDDAGSQDDQDRPAKPAPSGDCVERILVDHDQRYLAGGGNAGSAYQDQKVSGWFKIKQGDVVRSGLAVAHAHSDDFCTLEEAYPCTWEAFPRSEKDAQAASDEWMAYFGFTNVEGGKEYGAYAQGYRYHTDYVVRAWALLSDGTMVLDRAVQTGMWGHVRSYDVYPVQGREIRDDYCDVAAAGLWPEG